MIYIRLFSDLRLEINSTNGVVMIAEQAFHPGPNEWRTNYGIHWGKHHSEDIIRAIAAASGLTVTVTKKEE